MSNSSMLQYGHSVGCTVHTYMYYKNQSLLSMVSNQYISVSDRAHPLVLMQRWLRTELTLVQVHSITDKDSFPGTCMCVLEYIPITWVFNDSRGKQIETRFSHILALGNMVALPPKKSSGFSKNGNTTNMANTSTAQTWQTSQLQSHKRKHAKQHNSSMDQR